MPATPLEMDMGRGYERLILGTVLDIGRPALDVLFELCVEVPVLRGKTGDMRHANLWTVICELYEDGAPISGVSVAEQLQRKGDLDGQALLSLLGHTYPLGGLVYHLRNWLNFRSKEDARLEILTLGATAQNGASLEDLRKGLSVVLSGLDRYRTPDEFDDGPPRLVKMSGVKRIEVEWFWRPRIPYGFLSAIEGDPGEGKSFVSCALATAASRGRGLPGAEEERTPVPSLLLTAEDDLGATVRGRLEDMGADLDLIEAADRGFVLNSEGFGYLETMMVSSGARMVIIDPIVAYLDASLDIHRANEVRSVLKVLARMARKHHAAIVIIRHLSKGQAAKAIQRGQGSIDFAAACRSIMLVGREEDEPSASRSVVQIKCNLAALAQPVGYSIDQGQFRWTGESHATAKGILEPGAGGAAKDARWFLMEVLKEGPADSKKIEDEARAQGISRPALWRAKVDLKVSVRRINQEGGERGQGKWEWWMPSGST